MDLAEFGTSAPVTCSMTTPICAVARLMDARDVGSVIVLDDDEQLAGIVTDRDLVVRAMADDRGLETPVAKIMTSDVIWLREDASPFAAATEMATADCRRMPILDAQARVTGIIALDDLLTVFAAADRQAGESDRHRDRQPGRLGVTVSLHLDVIALANSPSSVE